MTSIGDYEVVCKVGQGAFGSVFKARRKADGALRVLKVMEVVGLSRREQEDALNEVKILASLRHEHIVRYDDSFVAGDALAIVMEYCELGDVHQALRARNGKLLPEPQVWRYLLQTLLGLHYIHSQRVLHRDLKTMNLFLSAKDTILIGDFGVARLMGTNTHFARTMVGTPYYLSPELCENRPYNDKSDMWALGCILYELCTLAHPFDAGNHGALILKIIRGKFPPPSTEYSRPLRELVSLLLSRRSERRPSAAALLAHPAIGAKASELGLALPPGLPAHTQPHRSAPRPPVPPAPLQPQQMNGPAPAPAGGNARAQWCVAPAAPPQPVAAAVAAVGGAQLAAAAARGGGRPAPAALPSFPQRQAVGGNRVRRMGPSGIAHPSSGKAAMAANRTAAFALAQQQLQQQQQQQQQADPPLLQQAGGAHAGSALPPARAHRPAHAPSPRTGACYGGALSQALRPVQPCASYAPPSVLQLRALERHSEKAAAAEAAAAAAASSFVPSQPLLAPRSAAELAEIAQVRGLGSDAPAALAAVADSEASGARQAVPARTAALSALAAEACVEFEEAVGARRAAALAALAASGVAASPEAASRLGQAHAAADGRGAAWEGAAAHNGKEAGGGSGGGSGQRGDEAAETASEAASDEQYEDDFHDAPLAADWAASAPPDSAWCASHAAASVGWKVVSLNRQPAARDGPQRGDQADARSESEDEPAGEEARAAYNTARQERAGHAADEGAEEEEAEGDEENAEADEGSTFALAAGREWAEPYDGSTARAADEAQQEQRARSGGRRADGGGQAGREALAGRQGGRKPNAEAAAATRARAAAAVAHVRSLRQHAAELQAECMSLVSPLVFAELFDFFSARASEGDAELAAAEPAGAAPRAGSPGAAAERSEQGGEDALVAFVYERIPLDKSEVITKIFQLLYLEEEIRELDLVAAHSQE